MSTTNLSDGSQATVAAAIAAAAAGDTLVIPAGTWTWSAGVTINKALTLQGTSTAPPASPGQGPGVSSSVIIRAGGLNGNTPLITIAPASDVAVRVTGLRLDNGLGTSYPGSNYVSIAVSGNDTTPLRQIRIDNCYFNTGSQVCWWTGGAYGLIDHCYFNNIWICILLYGGITDLGDLAYARNDYAPGSLNYPFIEDCIFKYALSANPGSPWVIYHQTGGRSVIRHCLIDGTAAPSYITGPVDCHGNQNYWKSSGQTNFRGTIRFEFYNNTVNLGHVFQIMDLRGGSHFIHDNTFTVPLGDTPNLCDFRDEEDDPANTPGIPVRSPVQWPCEDQITASFIYNNTLNGAAYNTVGVGGFGNNNASTGDPFYIKVNRDYWLKAPDGTTTTSYPTPLGAPSIAAYPAKFAALQTTSYTPAAYPHPMNINTGGGGASGGGGGGSMGGGSGAGTSNPPFQQVKFPPGPPTVPVWEDGPGFFVSPSNTGIPVRYSGQSQSRTIYTATPRPPAMTLPGAAVGMSALPVPPTTGGGGGVIPPPPTSYTLGDTTIEASSTSPGGGTLWCQLIPNVTVASRIQSISLYCDTITVAFNMRMGIYNGTASAPTTKVAEMDAPLLSAIGSTGWKTISLATPVAVNPGIYWLVWLTDSGGYNVHYKSGGAFYSVSQAYGALPASVPGAGSASSNTFSIYATFLTP